MRPKAMAGTLAILWGASIFVVGVLHLLFHGYGGEFLNMMASVYPGFHGGVNFRDVIVGTIYGVVDGAVGGYVFSLIYRALGRRTMREQIAGTPADPMLRRAS